MVEVVVYGDAIGIEPASSSNQFTVFAVPPFTVLSRAVKSKVAVPFPSSHSSAEAGLAFGLLTTVRVISTMPETQFPSPTVA